MLVIGFAIRERAHAIAAHEWVIETARRTTDPEGPPACVFDCSHKLLGDAAVLGWFAIGLMVLGGVLLVWSSVRPSKV